MRMDFRPDFSKKIFKNVEFDYKHLYETPGNTEEENPFNFYYDKMEFGYAITVHTSQGSSYPNVLYLHEGFMRDPEDNKKLMYTAITRASESCTVVI
jgi:superfamily I DNA/RNA helicase